MARVRRANSLTLIGVIASLQPATAAELAEALRDAQVRNRRVQTIGNAGKNSMGGPIAAPDILIATTALNRVIAYEPDDLTISVEAGMPWRDLTALLATHRQMIPLDPPFAASATVGGVIATNGSGPRQRLYGTARDVVIGMAFATMEGKVVRSGGMVVKNVAGLDMAKLMIGSFGTLAVIASVNFKLVPMPEEERSFLIESHSLEKVIAARNTILRGALQPAAIDVLSPKAAATIGHGEWMLAIRAGGSAAAMERYRRELASLGARETDNAIWASIEEFTSHFLERAPDGAVARASCTLKGLESALASLDGPVVARAGNGLCYVYFARAADAQTRAGETAAHGIPTVVEFAPEQGRANLNQWPVPGSGFETMRRIKQLFDPGNLLNPGRLYGRI